MSRTVASIEATITVRLGMLPHKAFVIFDRDDEVSAKVIESMRRVGDDSTPYNLCTNTSLLTRNYVMGNNENNSQLLFTVNISEKVESVCCQDCMIRHDETDIMLTSYMIHAVVTLGTNNSVRIDPLLMPYGVLFDLTSHQTSQMMAVDMSWTVGHSFNASHGPAGLHTDAYSINTLNMSSISTETP